MTVPILLLLVGLALIVLELMFPSAGMLGVAAALCLIGAIAAAFMHSTHAGVTFLVSSAIGVPLALWAGVKLVPRSPLRRLFVHDTTTFRDVEVGDPRDRALVGHEGVADSFLRPSGIAIFAGRRVDVVSRGEPIEAGARVRVLTVEGTRVVVARSQPADATEKP